jgi:hypothetical protein
VPFIPVDALLLNGRVKVDTESRGEVSGDKKLLLVAAPGVEEEGIGDAIDESTS